MIHKKDLVDSMIHTQGGCMPSSEKIYQLLTHETPHGIRNIQRRKNENPFHFYNQIETNQDKTFVVDATYKQFLDHDKVSRLDDVFVGTREELNELLEKYPSPYWSFYPGERSLVDYIYGEDILEEEELPSTFTSLYDFDKQNEFVQNAKPVVDRIFKLYEDESLLLKGSALNYSIAPGIKLMSNNGGYDEEKHEVALTVAEVQGLSQPLHILEIACHEIGHGLALENIKDNGAANEGESDYFVPRCMRRYFNKFGLEDLGAKEVGIEKDVKVTCKEFEKPKACELILQSAKDVLIKFGGKASYLDKDDNEFDGVLEDHPKLQCRLDTIKAALFNRARPKCWYNPKDRSPSSVTCEEKIDRSDVLQLMEKLRNEHFPMLKDTSIEIKEFDSDAYYLQTKPKILKLIGPKRKRVYFLEVNKNLYSCPPPAKGLEGILVHELEHINDYENMSTVQIAALGIKYATSKKWRSEYERGTDLKAVKKGYAKGLSLYRKWIYPKLSEKELELKKYYYMTPEELEL